jgi:pyridoxamine 5'-phosphate oxidase
MNLHDERTDYKLNNPIDPKDLANHPFEEFKEWYGAALNVIKKDPNAMILGTYDGKMPRSRVVLLKELDEKGFVFFTNYTSDKAKEIEQHPASSLTFFWKELERQVRVEGRVEKTSTEESDAYFLSRPLGSRLGAWASPQSSKIESREWLQGKVEEFKQKFGEEEVIRPENWGGYRLIPEYFEFWQGASSRLHDRIAFEKTEQGWVKSRLAP